MLDIGWTELLVIGVVALIVVGPKDLPGMFRTLGRFTAKLKGMAREFQQAMEDAADEAGVKDVGKDLRDATSPKKLGLDAVRDAVGNFEKWEPGKTQKAIGSETAKLTAERAEAARKIQAQTARVAEQRIAKETAARSAEAMATPDQPVPQAPLTKGATDKTSAKPAAKAPPKTAAKMPAKTGKSSAASKSSATRSAAAKTAAKPAAAKTTAAKKPASRKPAAKPAAGNDTGNGPGADSHSSAAKPSKASRQ